MSDNAMVVTFRAEKLTARTLRFEETGNSLGLETAVKWLYIQLAALAKIAPGKPVQSLKVKVTVEVIE